MENHRVSLFSVSLCVIRASVVKKTFPDYKGMENKKATLSGCFFLIQ